jgi:hypothetical protein
MRSSAALPLPLIFAALLFTGAARGAPPPLARALKGPAKESYEAARLLLANQDYAGALTKLEQAYQASKDPRLLYNMALCEKNLHAYAKMRRLFERYLIDAGDDVPATDARAVDLAIEAARSLVGELKLTVTENGARVSVDGEAVGTSPLADSVLLDLGKHTLKVEKPAFATVEQTVDVPGGTSQELRVGLKPVGTLVVTTDDLAAVAIDGELVGHGRTAKTLLVGQHHLKVSETGKVATEEDVDIGPGENRTLDVTLVDVPRAVVWPWIVAGAAVLAGGGVVGGYFLFKPSTSFSAPPVGTLGSAELRSHLVRLR